MAWVCVKNLLKDMAMPYTARTYRGGSTCLLSVLEAYRPSLRPGLQNMGTGCEREDSKTRLGRGNSLMRSRAGTSCTKCAGKLPRDTGNTVCGTANGSRKLKLKNNIT